MAVTYGTINRTKIAPQKWMTVTPVTLDSSYATGGESISANSLGLGQIDSILSISTDDGWQLCWNQSTSAPKILAMASMVGLSNTIVYSAMTDNTNTTGYKDFTVTVPAGSLIHGWKAVVSTGFTGDTTATMQVGVSGDLDRFSADTAQSCLAAGTIGSAAIAADTLDGVSAAVTPRVTVTGAADFTSISAGSMIVTVMYSAISGGLIEAPSTTDLSAVVGYVTAIGR